MCWNSAKSTRYDQILLCRPLPHQDRDWKYHFDRIRAFHILAALLDLIWGNGPYADKRYCSIFVRLAASELFYLHFRCVWWMILDISQARKILKEGGFPTWSFALLQYVSMCVCLFFIYIYRFIAILWWHHPTHLKFTHTSKSFWNISNFRPFCMGLSPEDIVIVLAANSLFFQWHFVTRRFVQVSYIRNWQSWISHFGLYNYHRVQWRGSETASKECLELCHGLIPNLWDFAQTYSLQIERQNQRGTFYSLDSENAIEPCISAFTDCLSWSTLDWVVALLVQVCDKICPVCQLSPLPKSGCPNERWRRLNIKCQHVSTFCSLSCQRSSQAWRKRTVLHSLASKFDPWVYSLFLRRMRPLGGWKSKGLEW